MTPFGEIMKRAVEATPNAIGGSFAASDGEMVDFFTTYDAFEWAVITAQYGVVLTQLHAAFGTFHFGSHDYFLIRHEKLDVILQSVDRSYYALLALRRDPATPDAEPFADALATLETVVRDIRKEMA